MSAEASFRASHGPAAFWRLHTAPGVTSFSFPPPLGRRKATLHCDSPATNRETSGMYRSTPEEATLTYQCGGDRVDHPAAVARCFALTRSRTTAHSGPCTVRHHDPSTYDVWWALEQDNRVVLESIDPNEDLFRCGQEHASSTDGQLLYWDANRLSDASVLSWVPAQHMLMNASGYQVRYPADASKGGSKFRLGHKKTAQAEWVADNVNLVHWLEVTLLRDGKSSQDHLWSSPPAGLIDSREMFNEILDLVEPEVVSQASGSRSRIRKLVDDKLHISKGK